MNILKVKDFKIYKTRTIGRNCLVYFEIPGKQNGNHYGDETLLFFRMTGKEVRKLKEIDLDFRTGHCGNEPMVLAKFEPTKWGWDLGISALKYLNFDYLKKK